MGTIDPDSGDLLLETIVVELNGSHTFPLATVSGIDPWDTMVVENLRNGVRRCGFVSPEGTVRATSESNMGDPLRIVFYKGPQIVGGSDHCELRGEAEPFAVVDSFGELVGMGGESYLPGDPLVALQEGLGMRRGHQDFRKLTGIAQMVLDPGDPAALAPHLLEAPLTYSSGEQTGVHSLIITTMGDTAVPVSGGILVGRAAGLIDYLEADPVYGKPINQELIDTFTAEGVHNLKRYTDSEGNGVHLDVEAFSDGDDIYGTEVPRHEHPFRIGIDETDPLGGASAAIFPTNVPTGQHGFDMPGGMTDKARAACLEACTGPEPDPCGCSTLETFDIGFFMMHMMGHYFRSDGQEISTDLCQARNDCADLPDLPPARDVVTLP